MRDSRSAIREMRVKVGRALRVMRPVSRIPNPVSRILSVSEIPDEREARYRARIPYRISRILPFLALAIASAGCHTGTLPDPNDIATAGPDTADVIMRQLQVASDSMNMRKDRKEINDVQYRIVMTQIAQDYVSQATDTTITDQNASTWGRVYSTARDWDRAEAALKQAVKARQNAAKSDFRALGDVVGDTLALSSAQAHQGKVHEAVETARSIFNVTPKAKAPILTSVLYDIVPAALRHGGGVELADLLQDAIKQHQEVLVDPNTDAGRDFLLARPHHIQHAWEEAARIYQRAGQFAMAQDAMAESRKIFAQIRDKKL